jgi:NADH-quinone oxidoreductase subunit N
MTATAEQILNSFRSVLPEALLLAAACGLFLAAAFVDSNPRPGLRHRWGLLSGVALAAALILWMLSRPSADPQFVLGPFRLDALAWLTRGLVLTAGVPLLLLAWNQVADAQAAESHACLLIILAGASLTAAANDLIGLFVALELVSIPTYVFLYLPRRDASAQEAVLKYFLLSVFSSAVVLYGFSYLYGAAGTTNLAAIRAACGPGGAAAAHPAMLAVGLLAVLAGLCFRLAAVPFHFYAPDVFQGVPTAGAALLAFVPKVVGFAALLRLAGPVLTGEAVAADLGRVGTQLGIVICGLAFLTMFAGNVLAVLQTDLKRLLAYSSIAHAGYMLIGLAVGDPTSAAVSGVEALAFYLAVYAAMTLGVFAIVSCLGGRERPAETISDLAGLSQTHPGTAFLLTVFLFSLTGLPPTAGFLGKLNLFWAAWSRGTFAAQLLAVLLAVNAAIAAWYYLRIVAAMYLEPSREAGEPRPIDRPAFIAAALCGIGTLALFFPPVWLWRLIERITA